MIEKLLIKNCIFKNKVSDILVENSKVSFIGKYNNNDVTDIIDADGLYACPGFVDIHVHLRDPGQTQKEDIITGCKAAAAGGVTTLACMPNTIPSIDNEDTINYILNKAKETGINVCPIASITKGLKGEELTDFAKLYNAGAVAFSDDGRPVKTAELMLKAMDNADKLNSIVSSHCEDLSLGAGVMNYGTISKQLGVKGIRNSAETCMVAREIALSLTSNLPIHICHVSAKESVELIRSAKRLGAKVTAETCPHYFSLDETKLLSRDASFKMNPPLRTQEDIKAVIEGLKDGTIDCIVTDHAPHTKEDKKDFEKSPNGIIGLETSFAVSNTYLVKKSYLTLEELIDKMTINPAKIMKLDAGTLNIGSRADIVLFDPQKNFVVDKNKFKSKSKNTPYDGMTLTGKVEYTISSGKVIYKNEDN